jgi:anti-anti-sigma factor
MAMAKPVKISVSRFSSGVVIRLAGAGTLGESPVVYAVATQVLGQPDQRVLIDLAGCTYMDSTFLGGLVSLFRRHGGDGNRFAIFAPGPHRSDLFGGSRLDTVLPFVDELPPSGEGVPIEPRTPASSEELARYVVECHRRLAELGGPQAQEYSRVADAIAAEVERGRRG